MRFLFNMMNHNLMGQRSLEDVIGIVGHQLRALGHEAIWDPRNAALLTGEGTMNVLVEGFTEQTVEVIRENYEKGARFICLATEEPTPKGFNHGTQPEMVRRQECFPLAAKYFEGVLTLVPGKHVTDWFSQFSPTAPIELGYAPKLVRPAGATREPHYDFGFYGSLSPRRLKILKKLANLTGKQNAIRVVADFSTQVERDVGMMDAKVILQVRKFEQMGLVSSSRCNTSLCIGRPVLAEPHDLSKPWDEVVTFAKTMEHFYSMALMMRSNWRSAHAAQFERFKTIMNPQWCIGDALEKIGLLDRAK